MKNGLLFNWWKQLKSDHTWLSSWSSTLIQIKFPWEEEDEEVVEETRLRSSSAAEATCRGVFVAVKLEASLFGCTEIVFPNSLIAGSLSSDILFSEYSLSVVSLSMLVGVFVILVGIMRCGDATSVVGVNSQPQVLCGQTDLSLGCVSFAVCFCLIPPIGFGPCVLR